MPFIPHTQSDIDAMLQAIGETSTAALFDEIPDDMRFKGELNLPDSLSEMALMRLMQQRASETKWPQFCWCWRLRASHTRRRLGPH